MTTSRSASTFTLGAYRFMREHAGYSYRPSIETESEGRVRCCLELARAEHALAQAPVYVEWTDDPDSYQEEGPHWVACLYDSAGELLGSLGGIDAPEGDPYRRVVEAELALQVGICHPLDRDISR